MKCRPNQPVAQTSDWYYDAFGLSFSNGTNVENGFITQSISINCDGFEGNIGNHASLRSDTECGSSLATANLGVVGSKENKSKLENIAVIDRSRV